MSDSGLKAPPVSRSPLRAIAGELGGRLPGAWFLVAVLAACFVWAFWYTFVDLWRVWQNNADYSAGQLVPLTVLYMVAARRRRLGELELRSGAMGFMVFLVGLVLNLAGAYYLYASLENLGIVISANGLVLALLGWKAYKLLWYPMFFLFLMVPLPERMHDAVMLPLQRMGSQISAAILEVVGVPVERYGHVLEVAGRRIAVAEACNGLRMVLAFVIVAGVVAFVVRRPRWQKGFILVSSIPIALACNVLRVVTTASLYAAGHERLARGTFHDGMGLVMMPAALLLTLLAIKLLPRPAASANAAGFGWFT